jgi:uncharacterized membrane protein YkoI
MKIRSVALAALALSAATAFATATAAASATTSPSDVRPLTLAQMVTHLESTYPGEVATIRFDMSAVERAHYHVVMRFPQSGLASVDVDAVTLAIASREPAALPARAATLTEAAALVATHLPGTVAFAEFDAAAGTRPHYDVDVRLSEGATARLTVDPATGQIAWRVPAVIED